MVKKGILVLYPTDKEELSELLVERIVEGPLETRIIKKMDIPFWKLADARCIKAAIGYARKNNYGTVFVNSIEEFGPGVVYECEFYKYDREKHFEKQRKELRKKLWKLNEGSKKMDGIGDISDVLWEE